MRATRFSLGGLGMLVGVYGAYLLLTRQDFVQIKSAAIWLAGGVVLHDGVLAFSVIALTVLIGRFIPEVARAPVAVAVIVLGSLTLLAVPVLGRFGVKDDNPTLLPRDYTAGWFVVAALTLIAVVVATVVRARRTSSHTPAPAAASADVAVAAEEQQG